jgi:hypothetical protein
MQCYSSNSFKNICAIHTTVFQTNLSNSVKLLKQLCLRLILAAAIFPNLNGPNVVTDWSGTSMDENAVLS